MNISLCLIAFSEIFILSKPASRHEQIGSVNIMLKTNSLFRVYFYVSSTSWPDEGQFYHLLWCLNALNWHKKIQGFKIWSSNSENRQRESPTKIQLNCCRCLLAYRLTIRSPQNDLTDQRTQSFEGSRFLKILWSPADGELMDDESTSLLKLILEFFYELFLN